MNSTNFASLVPWVISHGYLLFFIAAIIEGPLVTTAGGVAAALGYYNIFIIILLAVGGDIGGDFLYYGIGYNFNKIIKSGKLSFIGITLNRVNKIEELLHKKITKAVIFVKLAPVIGPPGLMILGAVRAPFKKFTKIALSIAIPKSTAYALLGFYSAATYVYLDKTIAHGQKTLFIIVGIGFLIYIAFQKITAMIAQKMEE